MVSVKSRNVLARRVSIALFLTLAGHLSPALGQDASAPYLGAIAMVAFDFAPKGWALCNGQLLAINQNQALFSLLGTTYGGDGRVNFGLPDLRGRIAVHASNVIQLGQRGGEETHTLTMAELPAHTHVANASSSVGSDISPGGKFPARDASAEAHYGGNPNSTMGAGAVVATGGSQPHENRMPFTVIHYIIALQGIFPSRN